MNYLPLIEKIQLLEEKLSGKPTPTPFEPYQFNSADPIKVQQAGKKIAAHLGLPAYSFIISYAKQKDNVGGHVQLDSSNDVFIELDAKYKDKSDMVWYILAHEICHKYLYVHNIKLFPTLENEILTDLTTIYTGLGKLTLNGCEFVKVSMKVNADNTSTTTTQTEKLGYLTRQQFAFAYRLVGEMRRIPIKGLKAGLNEDAKLDVMRVNKENFNVNYFKNDYVLETIKHAGDRELLTAQKQFAQTYRHLRTVENQVLAQAKNRYQAFHTENKKTLEKLLPEAKKSHAKESHNYVKNLILLIKLKQLRANSRKKEEKIQDFNKITANYIQEIAAKYPAKSQDFLFHFECPSCANKMKISQKKLVRINCKSCAYTFIVDTGADKPEVYEVSKEKGGGLWAKAKSLFGK